MISLSNNFIFTSILSTCVNNSLQFNLSNSPFSIINALIFKILFVSFLILFSTIKPLFVGSINSLVTIAIINPIIIDINLCIILVSLPTPTLKYHSCCSTTYRLILPSKFNLKYTRIIR